MRILRKQFGAFLGLVGGLGLITISTAINAYIVVEINKTVNSSATASALLGQGLALFTTVLNWVGIAITIVSAVFIMQTWRQGGGAGGV